MMELYGLKNCDTCRKALKELPNATFADVRADGVPAEVMARAHKQFGAALLNTRSTTWRGLDDETRQMPPLALLGAHPALMKRPLIVAGDRMYLGWGNDVRAALGIA
jgi:arsenate reductase-like glutaredoxin family protein